LQRTSREDRGGGFFWFRETVGGKGERELLLRKGGSLGKSKDLGPLLSCTRKNRSKTSYHERSEIQAEQLLAYFSQPCKRKVFRRKKASSLKNSSQGEKGADFTGGDRSEKGRGYPH